MTKQEIDKMLSMHDAGLSYGAIAADFSISKAYAGQIIRDAKLARSMPLPELPQSRGNVDSRMIRVRVAVPAAQYHELLTLPECKALTPDEAIVYAVLSLIESAET